MTSAAEPLRSACIQLTSNRDPAKTFSAAATLVREATVAGALLVTTPEVTLILEPGGRLVLEKVRPGGGRRVALPVPRPRPAKPKPDCSSAQWR